jgi:protein-S-isoprenylcysteine O-methyltransferase Ste14
VSAGPDGGRSPIGAWHVVLVAAVVVAVVLGLQLVSLVVPEVGRAVGVMPLLIVALVLVTAVVLLGAVRKRR